MRSGELGDTWQYDPADPACGITRPVIYHQATPDCDIVDEEWTSHSVRVECSCGAVYASGVEQ